MRYLAVVELGDPGRSDAVFHPLLAEWHLSYYISFPSAALLSAPDRPIPHILSPAHAPRLCRPPLSMNILNLVSAIPFVTMPVKYKEIVRALSRKSTSTSDIPTADTQSTSRSLPSAAQRLPTEMVQQIYHSLGPLDFQNARSTCSSWRYAGLDRSILYTQIRRGGWLGVIVNEHNDQVPTIASLSNVVARETSLTSREAAEHESEANSCLFRAVIDHCITFPVPEFSGEAKRPSEAETETRSSFWHRARQANPVETQSNAKHT